HVQRGARTRRDAHRANRLRALQCQAAVGRQDRWQAGAQLLDQVLHAPRALEAAVTAEVVLLEALGAGGVELTQAPGRDRLQRGGGLLGAAHDASPACMQFCSLASARCRITRTLPALVPTRAPISSAD